MVLSEVLLTQLIFEHSLRIRTACEVSEVTETLDDSTARQGASEGDSTKYKREDRSNLTGKINNLMSTVSVPIHL